MVKEEGPAALGVVFLSAGRPSLIVSLSARAAAAAGRQLHGNLSSSPPALALNQSQFNALVTTTPLPRPGYERGGGEDKLGHRQRLESVGSSRS